VSDQHPQPASGETGTLGAGPAAPDMPAPVAAAAEVEAAKLAPEQEETSPKPDAAKDAPKVDAPKVDAVKMETPKVEASKAEPPKIDAVKPEAPRFPGNVTIMSPGDRVGADAKAAPVEGSAGKRRIGAMAAVVALATVAGALGGALATAGVGKLMAGGPAQESAQASVQAPAKDSALEASVARLDAEIVAMKSSLEHNSRTTTGQLNKASDRLDKVEKAQARRPRRRLPPRRLLRRKSQGRYRSRLRPQRRLRLRQRLGLHPSPRLPGCRPSKAGCCGTSPTAAP